MVTEPPTLTATEPPGPAATARVVGTASNTALADASAPRAGTAQTGSRPAGQAPPLQPPKP